jgi:hypothetical protein
MAKRKMTAEQKQAAVERLAKAREKRLRENPPEYKNIAMSVQNLPDDHKFSMQNVKEWIKVTQDKIGSLKVAVRQNVKGAASEVASLEGYVRNMRLYLDSGDWVDDFYGAEMEGKMKHRCLAMAYHADGTPKRTVGVFYDDIGVEWTKDMDDESRK